MNTNGPMARNATYASLHDAAINPCVRVADQLIFARPSASNHGSSGMDWGGDFMTKASCFRGQVFVCFSIDPFRESRRSPDSKRLIEFRSVSPTATHRVVGNVSWPISDGPMRFAKRVYAAMQSSRWSPYGEANRMLSQKGFDRTSMTPGDVLLFQPSRQLAFDPRPGRPWIFAGIFFDGRRWSWLDRLSCFDLGQRVDWRAILETSPRDVEASG